MAQQYPPGPPQPWSTPDQTGFGQPDAYVQPDFDAQPTVEPTGIAGPDGSGVVYPQVHPPVPVPVPVKRRLPAWRIVLGTLFGAWTAFMTVAVVIGLLTDAPSGDGPYLFGFYLGLSLFVGVPALLTWLCLRRPRR